MGSSSLVSREQRRCGPAYGKRAISFIGGVTQSIDCRTSPKLELPLLYRGIRQEQSYFISLFSGVRFGFGK